MSLDSPADAGRLRWLLLVALALVGARTAWLVAELWGFTTDDAYITLRYSANLVAGHGIVWNVGEQPPVEGYSNFSHVLLGALLMLAGADAAVGFKALGVVALGGACALIYGIARRLVGPLAAAGALLLYTGYQGTILWTVSGLETLTFVSVVLGATRLLLAGLGFPPVAAGEEDRPPSHPPDARRLAAAGACVFVASLVRVDGPLVLSALLVVLLVDTWQRATGTCPPAVRRAHVRGVLCFLAAFAVPYALYTGWRLSHFGDLLPNTVHCKSSHAGDPMLLTGEFLAAFQLFLLVSLVRPLRGLDARGLVAWLLPAIYGVALYGADPLVGYGCRHFLAAAAVLMPAVALGVRNVVAVAAQGLRRTTVEALALGVMAAWSTVHVTAWHGEMVGYVQRYQRRIEARAALGRWIRHHVPQDATVLLGDVGLAAYLGERDVMDAFCLNNLVVARGPAGRDPRWFATHAMSRKPEYVVVHSSSGERLAPLKDYGVYPMLVSHPAFAKTYDLANIIGPRRGPVLVRDDIFYWIFKVRAVP